MLPDFFKVCQTRLLPFQNSTHSSQCGSLEAFASVETVSVFDHADHITGDCVYEGSGSVDLSEGEFVVVLVVEGVTEIGVEWVNVVEAGEVG